MDERARATVQGKLNAAHAKLEEVKGELETAQQRSQASRMELEKEKAKSRRLQDNVASLSDMLGKRSGIIETPMQTITSIVEDLLGADAISLTSEEVRESLKTVKRIAVGASNVYRPAVTQILASSSVDEVTKSFLLNQLGVSLPVGDPGDGAFAAIHADAAAEVGQWSFCVFEHSDLELLTVVKEMFVQLDFLRTFRIRESALESFLMEVMKMYHQDNAYHNWRHAVDVAQASFCFLTHFKGHVFLNRAEMLAVLVAALCHDMDHPGVSNAFLVSTGSDLALQFNDRAVLENFHASSLFQMLRRNPHMDIFGSLTAAQSKDMRSQILECILATDMSEHFEHVTKLSIKASSDEGGAWDASAADQRLLLMKCIIKMSDISNVARGWDRGAFEWGKRIGEEMFAQGDREKALGLEPAMFLDRERVTVSTNCMNFIDFVAGPFFDSFGKLHPEFQSEVVSLLWQNRERWEQQGK